MLLMPFLHDFHGEIKFLHVIRDGRDMAFSANRNQLRVLEGAVLSAAEVADPRLELKAMTFWARTNMLVADYAETHLANDYMRIRYEDLGSDPYSVIWRIIGFVGGDLSNIARAVEEVRPSRAMGRWRQADEAYLLELVAAGRAALVRFGYVSDPTAIWAKGASGVARLRKEVRKSYRQVTRLSRRFRHTGT